MRLPNDTGKWKDKIYKRLLRMHPYLTEKVQGDIDWSVEPVDQSSGDAIGIITAKAGAQPIRIPVIVRDNKLKPIDMYLRPDGEMDVLDESVIMENPVPQSASIGRKINPHNGRRLYNGSPIQLWAIAPYFAPGRLEVTTDDRRLMDFIRAFLTRVGIGVLDCHARTLKIQFDTSRRGATVPVAGPYTDSYAARLDVDALRDLVTGRRSERQ